MSEFDISIEDQVLDYLKKWADSNNLKFKNDEFRKGSHKQDPAKLYGLFMQDLSKTYPTAPPFNFNDFSLCLSEALEENNDFSDYTFKIPTVESVAEFVPQCLDRKGLTISPLGDEVTDKYGKSINFGELENILLCETHLYNEESYAGGKALRSSMLVGAIKEFIKMEIQERSSKHWQTTRQSLVFCPGLADHADAYLRGIIKAFNFQGDAELNLAVFKQWIWQTKRYFSGDSVADPLMLNLYAAKGGGGKTQIVKKLSEPLEDYRANSTLETILDTREHGLFTDRYIVFFDEMSLGKIEHGQIGPLMAGLKKLITEDKITQRNMRETTHSKKRRTFSPIATSNMPLAQMLPDDSGMRRFFEIEMLAEPNTERVGKLRALDASIIWRGIDETLERGYIVEGSAIHKKLVAHQAELKYRSILDDCLDNMDDLPVTESSAEGKELLRMEAAGHNQKALEDKAEELGLRLYKVFEYRKILREWTEDNLDKFLARYIPGNNNLPQQLQSRGFVVLARDKRNIRVVIQEDLAGGGYV